jgi:zinc/manganese transport system permease protein
VLVLWFGYGGRLGRIGFYLLFAVTITASVQLVGIYLVFATLILPALPVNEREGGLVLAYAGAIVGYAVGFLATIWVDLPAGPTVVCALAAASAASGAILSGLRRQ